MKKDKMDHKIDRDIDRLMGTKKNCLQCGRLGIVGTNPQNPHNMLPAYPNADATKKISAIHNKCLSKNRSIYRG